MRRIALRIAYEGTNFHGWQRQEPPGLPALRTVQGEVTRALVEVMRAPIHCQGASRTDSGVHAQAQVAAFTADCRVPLQRIPAALNARLPEDIRIMSAWHVPDDFDPVRNALAKCYRYEIACRHPFMARLPFDRKFVYALMYALDVDRMRAAAMALIGEHDFKGFAHSQHGRECTVRTIYSCEVNTMPDDRVVIDVSGSGFLYNMVRIIAGTLVEVGRGRIDPAQMPAIVASSDRSRAGPTFPANGLQLRWIYYPPDRSEPVCVT